LRDFLDNSAVSYQTAKSGAELKTGQIASNARAFTMLISCTANEEDRAKNSRSPRSRKDRELGGARMPETSLNLRLAIALWLSLAVPAAAGPLDDGVAAYQKGDLATALRLTRPLAEQGNASAQALLALMYALGQGVPQDYATALVWYRKAADQGLASAQSDLAAMYEEGLGVKADAAAALVWYRKAAEQGFAGAEYKLGLIAAEGRGVPKDLRAALVWLAKAAEHGSAAAHYRLAVMYESGDGVPQDRTAAVIHYRAAAERGEPAAQYKLGAMYQSGEGMPRDYVMAYMWFNLAASAGNVDALEGGEAVARRLTAAQMTEAQKLVREWKPRTNY
jgi:TPR repeat protein